MYGIDDYTASEMSEFLRIVEHIVKDIPLTSSEIFRGMKLINIGCSFDNYGCNCNCVFSRINMRTVCQKLFNMINAPLANPSCKLKIMRVNKEDQYKDVIRVLSMTSSEDDIIQFLIFQTYQVQHKIGQHKTRDDDIRDDEIRDHEIRQHVCDGLQMFQWAKKKQQDAIAQNDAFVKINKIRVMFADLGGVRD